jgi:uncharacterized membrane protein
MTDAQRLGAAIEVVLIWALMGAIIGAIIGAVKGANYEVGQDSY